MDTSAVKNYLVISVLGEDRPGLISELARVILDCNCNIVDGRMTELGGECSAIFLVYGNWNTLAKLEVQLERLKSSLGVEIAVKRTTGGQRRDDVLPYAIEVIAHDQPGIVHRLANFFAGRSINIEELVTRSYSAPHTGAPMFSVNMVIGVPGKIHIAMLRDEFMDFCDEFNWDAVMEPVKG
ncbi:MAG: glycine cleavage system protein R [Gammaproteobacteria bacterium]